MTSSKRGPGRPRANDQAPVSRDDIVQEAGAMFATLGYEATSVRELNRRLGVSETATHHYFPTKHDLWIAAAEHTMGVVHSALRAGLEDAPTKSGRDAVHANLVEFFCLHAQYPEAAKMMLHEALAASPRLDHLYERFVAWPRQAREALLADEIDNGTVRWGRYTSTAVLVLAHGAAVALGSPELLRLYGGPDTHDPDDVRAFAEELATVIIDGLQPHGARP